MIGLLSLLLALLTAPFKSKIRLEAENVALRHQLIVLRRDVKQGDQVILNPPVTLAEGSKVRVRAEFIAAQKLASELHPPPIPSGRWCRCRSS